MSPQLHLDEDNLAEYLRNVGILQRSETPDVLSCGEGNINWVRRVRVGARSWVVKQARPALERFPEYRVSTERLDFEARYYEVVAPLDREGVCPRVHAFDAGHKVLVLEDLSGADRLDAVQDDAGRVRDAAEALARFLGAVHAGTRDPALARRFENGEMQRLHGDHIFQLPFRPNDFPLSPALAQRAGALRSDSALVAAIDAAYARYLEPRGALVHADVQPTNVLLARGGTRLLDAEIAHVGDPAFDVGVLLAHLLLPAVAAGDPGRVAETVAATWAAYSGAHAGAPAEAEPPPFADAARYAGIEMLRRTLGAARVPAVESDGAGLAVVDYGSALVANPPVSPTEIEPLGGS